MSAVLLLNVSPIASGIAGLLFGLHSDRSNYRVSARLVFVTLGRRFGLGLTRILSNLLAIVAKGREMHRSGFVRWYLPSAAGQELFFRHVLLQ